MKLMVPPTGGMMLWTWRRAAARALQGMREGNAHRRGRHQRSGIYGAQECAVSIREFNGGVPEAHLDIAPVARLGQDEVTSAVQPWWTVGSGCGCCWSIRRREHKERRKTRCKSVIALCGAAASSWMDAAASYLWKWPCPQLESPLSVASREWASGRPQCA